MKHAAAAMLCMASGCTVNAQEVYGQGGFLGGFVGVSQKVSERVALRADIGTAGRRRYDTNEEGIEYSAKFRSARAGLFGDWFVSEAGNFRLTGGVTINDYRWQLSASGSNGSLTIGNTTYLTTGADRLNATIKTAPVTPYLGVGWGHQGGKGLRFVGDLGVSYGRGRVTISASGPLAAQVAQSDIDRETAELRDAVNFIRWIPQITFGVGYTF